jgi:WD40 repeat protein
LVWASKSSILEAAGDVPASSPAIPDPSEIVGYPAPDPLDKATWHSGKLLSDHHQDGLPERDQGTMTHRHIAFCAFALILSFAAGDQAQGQDDLFQEPPVVPSIEPTLVLSGHEKAIHGVALSPDGKRIASAGEDTAILWDATTGKRIVRLDPGGRPDAFSVAFSPDGKTLAVGGYFGDVFLYDAVTGKLKGKLDEPSLPILCLAYSPDGSVLAASHDHAEVMLFDARQSKLLGTIKPAKGTISWFAFSADGKTLATITTAELSTWNVETRKLLKSLPQPQAGFEWAYSAVTCSPKSPVVVATGGQLLHQKTVAYDLKTLRPQGSLLTLAVDPSISKLSFSPDGKVLASAGGGTGGQTAVTLWDVSTGERFAALVGQKESLNQVVFSSDGGRVAAAGGDKTVAIWTVKAGPASGTTPKTKAKAKAKKSAR